MTLFKKLRNIIVGNWRNLTGYTSDEQKRRLDICNRCEHKMKYMGSYICDQCGCIVSVKMKNMTNHCVAGKW